MSWWRSLSYEESFKESARTFKISPSWLAAIACCESGYKAKTTDGKGSFGIMQMQVSTAKIVAKRFKIDPDVIDEKYLTDHPEECIQFAACHFRDLLNTFGNSYYWATRAYNGGSTRIRMSKNGSKRYKNLSLLYYTHVEQTFNAIKEFEK